MRNAHHKKQTASAQVFEARLAASAHPYQPTEQPASVRIWVAADGMVHTSGQSVDAHHARLILDEIGEVVERLRAIACSAPLPAAVQQKCQVISFRDELLRRKNPKPRPLTLA